MSAIAVDCVKTGRNLLDVLQTDGLIEHASPAGLKSTCNHFIVGTHGRGGKEEWVLAMYATEVDAQVGVIVGRDIVGTDGANQFLDADRPIIMNAGLLGGFQVGIGTVGNPLQGRLVVVEADGADGSGRVASLAGFGAGSVLA